MPMPSRDEIFEKVQAALVDALGVDDDEVTPEATMVGDLGACLLYTSPSPRDGLRSRMPSSA